MGLFKKLEEKMDGAVKVKIEVLSPVDNNSPSFEAKITVSNTGDQPQTINKVTANLLEEKQDANVQAGTPDIWLPVRSATYEQPFTLQPGQSQEVNIVVPVHNEAGPLQAAMPQVNEVSRLANIMQPGIYIHSAEAVVAIAGKAINPTNQTPLNDIRNKVM